MDAAENGAGGAKIINSSLQKGILPEPSAQQRRQWSKEGLCTMCGGSDHKRRSNKQCKFYGRPTSCEKGKHDKPKKLKKLPPQKTTPTAPKAPKAASKGGGWLKWASSIHIQVPLLPLWPSNLKEGSQSEAGENTNESTNEKTSSSSSSSKSQQQEEAAKESCYYTPTVYDCGDTISFNDIEKGEFKDWVIVDYCSKGDYVPVFDLKSDNFVSTQTSLKLGIRKQQRGPMKFVEEPAVGTILDRFFPDFFIKETVENSNDYVKHRRTLQPDLKIWKDKKISAPYDNSSVYHLFACLYYMGIVKLPSKSDYFCDSGYWPYHPVMRELGMTCDCFTFLWRHLYLSTVDMSAVEAKEEMAEQEIRNSGTINKEVILMEPVVVHCDPNGE